MRACAIDSATTSRTMQPLLPQKAPPASLPAFFRHLLLPGLVVLLLTVSLQSIASAQAGPAEADRLAMQQGAAAMKAGNFSAAAAAYRFVTEHQPAFAEGFFNLGLALQQAGLEGEASVALEKASRLKPELRGPNLFLGILAYRRNQFKEAEAFLGKETRLDPRNAKPYMWLGVCHLAQDDPQGAIAPLDKAYALDPNDVDILYHRGRAYLLVANASYAAMFKIDRDSVRVHQVLAEANVMSTRTQEAIREFELAVRMAPRQPGLHEELGNQYWVAGELDKAGDAYREELKIDPHAVSARYKLGSLLVLNQKYAEGVELLQAVLQEDPGFADAHYYMGLGLVSLEKESDATHQFELAIAPDPNSDRAMSAWYKLAQIYRKTHDTARAQEAMQKFLALRARTKERQAGKKAEIVRKRNELPVEDPDKDAMDADRGTP